MLAQIRLQQGIATAAKGQQPSVSEARCSQNVSQMCQSCCGVKWVECEEDMVNEDGRCLRVFESTGDVQYSL